MVRRLRWRLLGLLGSAGLASSMMVGVPAAAHADSAGIGSLAGSVTFSQGCYSGIGVGIAFDGTNLWYSCYDSSPDLLRADPATGQVTGSWNIAGGLGSLAYDAKRNAIWAGWGGPDEGAVRLIQLDANHDVTSNKVAFSTCDPNNFNYIYCYMDIDDGLAYDATDDSIYISPDTSTVIRDYATDGTFISQFPWAGTGGCYNSGLAIGDQLLFEGADGCSHVYVVNRSNPSVVLDEFSTAIPGDPNFRDEGLACDPTTFAAQGEQVMWSKEAYSPMRAHAFVVPDGSCGVGGQPAPGGGNLGYVGPLPLLIAHGITGSAGGETAIEGFAQDTVPGLKAPKRVQIANTGAVSSVWDNADEIDNEAQQMVDSTGAPAINVIAHSKGGLDTRIAMWQEPGLFNSLGMLSTPNGGSAEANKLCTARGIPWWVSPLEKVLENQYTKQFGPCHNDSDGLYDLQTGYVRNVINDIVRDDPELSYFDLGSNCSTGYTTYKCNLADNALLNCPDGGDTAVCLNSAYWLTDGFWPNVAGGLEVGLPPLSGYQHSQMNNQPCPVTDMLSVLYPLESQGNPWIDGDGSGCENVGSGGGIPDVVALARPAATTAPSSPTSSAPTPNGPWADQQGASSVADPTHPFTATLNPEGADAMIATVFLPAGVNPTLTVTDQAGNVDPNAVVDLAADTTGTAQTAVVSLSGLNGGTRTLTVGVDTSSEIILTTQVSSATALTASATPTTTGAGTNTTVAATLTGVNPGQSKKINVAATYTDAAGNQVTTPLAYSTSSLDYTGEINVPAGSYATIAVTAIGSALTRYATTGIILPDASGRIGSAHDDALLDTNGDGQPDTLRIPIQVTTSRPGNYHLSVDLAAAGKTIASGTGDATLAAGIGDIMVNVPLARLLAASAPSGSFEIVRGTLSEGTSGRTLIARATDMGATATYDLDSYTPAHLLLSRMTTANIDTDNDGLFDELRVSGQASVPSAGQYQLTGALHGPDGTVLQQIDQTETLASGRNPITVDLDGNLIGSTGSGNYQLSGLTLTSLASQTDKATIGAMFISLDASQWIGTTPNAPTLSRLWEQAQQAGAIHRYGLYMSEHNRLNRITDAAASAGITTETRELDTFIGDVAGADNTVDTLWQQRVLGYARALRSTLGG